ncbi:MAG: phenylalanine--tRNA ligase subunit beta [Chloroflexota bacterium]
MRAPLSWLREYVDIDLPAAELGHRLTMAGNELESIDEIGADWEQIHAARVTSIERHPQADNLFVVGLDVGPLGLTRVVTAATNLTVGALVPLVRPGGRLPDGRTIGAQEFRGVTSQGMLCSGDELGISPDRSGIYVMDEGDAEPGDDLRTRFGDTVLDLYITPNRVDCMSIIGIAREIHAITGAPWRRPTGQPEHAPQVGTTPLQVTIEAPDLCRRFTGAVIQGVTVKPSPGWLQRRLHLAGVRPISNVVDATNYVMLEYGQPQHAFDADRVGGRIVVRRARPGERLTTLDDVDRELDGEMLVIADAEKAVAVAGVMGGSPTEVHPGTTSVILETANFAPGSIRRTSSTLRLGSEASRRYERGLHADLAIIAARRCADLLQDHAGGRQIGEIVDVYPTPVPLPSISFGPDALARILGRRFPSEEIARVLTSLDFTVTGSGDSLTATPPFHRLDIEGVPDLAEEVARVTGYDNIPDTLPSGVPPEPRVEPLREAAERARDVLVGCGLQEIMTYSLVSAAAEQRVLGTGAAVAPIEVENAISAEQNALRTSLLPSVLEVVRSNLRHRPGVAVFEVARVYLPPLAPLPTERTRLCIALTGPAVESAWNAAPRDWDFYDLKGVLDALAGSLGVQASYQAQAVDYLHPGRSAAVRFGGTAVGVIGQLHPLTAERVDLRGREVVVADLDFEAILASAAGQPQITSLPRFPALERDIALIVADSVTHDALAATIRDSGGPLLASSRLFDVYVGEPLPTGTKSLAFALSFRAPDRTLTDDEADRAVAAIVAAAGQRHGAVLRGS